MRGVELEVALEREIGPLVGEGVRALLARERERIAHALAGLEVPGAGVLDVLGIVEPGLRPDVLLRRVGPGVVAARDEDDIRVAAHAGAPDLRERCLGREVLDSGRVALGPDDVEVVVRKGTAVHAVALLHEGELLGGRVDEERVGVAALGEFDREARALRGDLQVHRVGRLVDRGQVVEQARVLERGRGRDQQVRPGTGVGGRNGRHVRCVTAEVTVCGCVAAGGGPGAAGRREHQHEKQCEGTCSCQHSLRGHKQSEPVCLIR